LITVFVRTVLVYTVIIVSLRLLGKRQIGELEPSELVVAVLISEVAAIPMQDNRLPLLAGIVPVITLVALELVLSQLTLNSPRFRALMCGVPSVVIMDGRPVQAAMRRNRLSIDELMEELRSQAITDIADVRCAILETNGSISVIPWAAQQPVTASQMGISSPDAGLFIILINDGRVMGGNLKAAGLDRVWLEKAMRKNGVSDVKDVFLLSIDKENNVRFIAKEKA